MGQNNARQRLEAIKENVDEITEKIKADELTEDDRNRSHDILLDYIKEIKFILSKSLKASRIRKVEELIIATLQELATFEKTLKTVKPRRKAKSMQTLHDVEKDVKDLADGNLGNEKGTVRKYTKHISLVQDIDHEVEVEKNKELEAEDQLRQAEEKHYRNKLELSRFVGVSQSRCYIKHKEHLLGLKEEILNIAEVSPRISEKKSYLLYNVDNNIAALDKKVRENEDNIKRIAVEEEVFRATTPILNNHNLMEDVLNSYTEFERSFSANCTLDELQDVFKQLSELKIKIDQKLNVLENQIQIQDADPYIQLVPVKESDEYSFQVIKEVEVPASITASSKLKDIQKAVEYLQEQMNRSKYTKDSQTYQNWKKELEDYKVDLGFLTIRNEEDQADFDSVSKYIDDVLDFLDSHYTDRRSTTGDILIDIMTASTNVNELGSKIQNNDVEDFDYIENELMEYLYYLKKLEIPASRSNVCKFRDYVVIQIDSHLSRLEKIKKRLHTPRILVSQEGEMLGF